MSSEMDDALRIAARAVQLYAETHPRPAQVTQGQAAEMLGVHPKTVKNYIASGKLTLNGCGLISIGGVDELLGPHKLRKAS